MDAVAADDRGDIGQSGGSPMAITLGRRKRARREPAATRVLDDLAQAERAAVTALAETLRSLAAGLPRDSMLAAEFASVARSIDVAGVLGTWRLNGLAGEGHDSESSGGSAALRARRRSSAAPAP
jgi:hypothetical protein